MKKNENIRYKMVKIYLFHLIFICLEFTIAILLGIFSKKAIQISNIGKIMLLIVLIINILFALISLIVIAIKYKFAFKEKGYVYDFFLLIANLFFVIGNSINFIGIMLHTDLTLVSLIFSIMFNSMSLGIWLIRLLVTKKAFKEEKISLSFNIILLFVLINSILYIYQIKWLAILFLSIICLILFMMLMKILFISDIKLDKLYKIGGFTIIVLLEICLIAFVIYLLFWNPNTEDQSLFNSVMGVYAGLLGGLLTLVGVSWTIKNQEKIRREEKLEDEKKERLKYKPYFSACTGSCLKHNLQKEKIYAFGNKADYGYIQRSGKNIVKTYKEKDVVYYIEPIAFTNSDQSNFIINQIFLDEYKSFNKNILIGKNDKFYIDGVYIIKKISIQPKIAIEISDILGNKYKYNLCFDEQIFEEKFYDLDNLVDKKDDTKFLNLQVRHLRVIGIERSYYENK